MLLIGSHRARLLASTALCFAGLAFAPGAQANPREGTVAAGQATIQQTAPNRVDIIQRSDRAVIDWRQFSIGQGEHTHFEQPGAGSVTLNRVTGPDASKIDGKLTATGNVYLVNPNGVMFGPTAKVDVGGLVATTSDIRNDNFMAGRDRFDQPSAKPDARVENAGTITVKDGGLAALVAPGVENKGVIQAKLGRVAIAGADRFAVDLNGDGLLSFEVGPAPAGAKVTHSGTIKADGGTVLLTAEAAKGVVDNVINVSGVIEAKAVSAKGGTVVLSGGGGGVTVAGTIDASGAGATQSGGTVKVLGDKIALENGARIDASGPNGGGTVLVGGNWQGQGPERNATQTTVAKDAVIAAESEQGPGGKVVVWADKKTRVDGKIRAKRGKVETSGKESLAVGASASVEAAEWLLDPRNVTITSATANFDTGTFTPTGDDATVDAATIVSALNSGANVTVTTGSDGTQAGNITVASALSWNSNKTLTLNAASNVAINATIDANNQNSGFSIFAGGTITQTAAIDVRGTTTLDATGAITLTNTGNDFGKLTITKGASADIFGTGSLELGGVANLTGTLKLTATGNITQSGAIGAGGLVSMATDSDKSITLDGFANGIGSFRVTQAKDVSLKTSGAVALDNVSIAGDLSVTAGGHITQAAGSALSLSNGGVTAAVTTADTDIRLDTGANSIKNGLTLAGTLGNIRDLGLRNTRADAAVPSLTGLNLRNLALSFDNAAISLSQLSLTGALTVNAGGNIAVTSAGDLVLAGVGTTGNAAFQAAGTITDTGNLSIGGLADFTTVTATGAAITLDSAGNSFGSLKARVLDMDGVSPLAAPITVVMSSGTAVAGLLTGGDATITAGGALTDSGTLQVAGLASFTTRNDTGAAITLDEAGNSFGSLSLRTLQLDGTTPANGNLSVTYGAGLTLAGLTTAGNATVIADGAISQSAAFSVGGLASFQSRSDSGAAITLTNAGNSIASLSAHTLNAAGNATAAGAIQVANAGNLNLARLDTTADASITADGLLTDSGALTIGGAASFTTRSDSGAAITLDNGHSFGSLSARVLSADGSTVKAAPITVKHDGALVLTALQTGGSATISAGGAITDDGTLSIGGAASFTTLSNSGAAITLDASGNSFGSLSLRVLDSTGTASRNADVTATVAGALTLGTVQTAGDATFAAGGAITDTGTLTVNGTARFTTLNDSGAAVTLDSNANHFGTLQLRARNANDDANASGAITISMAEAVALGALETSAGASLTTGGLTQTAALHVGGTLTLGGAVANTDIDLTAAGNSFAGLAFTGALGNIRDLALRNTGALNLSALGSLTGLHDLYLRLDTAGISLPAVSLSGNLTLVAGGNISQTGRILAMGGVADLTSTGSITLTDSSNNFGSLRLDGTSAAITDANGLTISDATLSGSLTATALSGDLSVQATGALNLAGLSSQGNATVSATGAITDSGILAVTGVASFTTRNDAGAAITLDQAGSIFGSLALRSRNAGNTAARGGTLTLSLAGNLTLAGLETTGNAGITTTGQITQTGAAIVGGTATFNVGGGNNAVLTRTDNDFGTVRFLNVGNAQVTDLDDITLGGSTISGSLTVRAGGAIGQSGALNVSGAASFTTLSDAGAAITLNTVGNSFGSLMLRSRNAADTARTGGNIAASSAGALTITQIETAGSASLSAGGAINVSATGSLDIAGLSTPSSASITATGAITDSGNLSTGGLFSALTLNNAGAAITLDSAGNSLAQVSLRARNASNTANANGAITFRTSGALDIAQLDTAASADLTAGGSIIDSGLLTVGSGLSLKTRTTSGAGITIDNIFNTFGSFGAQVRDAGDTADRNANIVLTRFGSFQLGSIRTGGDLTVVSTGAVSQSGAAVVAGTASFNTSGQSVTLNQAGNDFGKVAFSNVGSTTLTDASGVELLASTISGNFTLSAGGAVTQTGVLNVSGALSLAATAANVDFRLDSQANQIDGGVSFAGTLGNVRDVQLRNLSFNAAAPVVSGLSNLRNLTLAFDNRPVLLRAAHVGGNLIVTSGRNISQLEAVTVAGSTVLSAGTGFDIALNLVGNDFTSLQMTSGRSLALRDATGINLAGINATGDVAVTAGGAITDSAAIVTAGSLSLKTLNDAGAAITLDQAGNSYGVLTVRSRNASDTAAANGGITVNKSGGLTLDGLETAGNASITTTGDILAFGAEVGGTTTINVGASHDVLISSGDLGTLRFTSVRNASVQELGGLVLGQSNVSGNLSILTTGAVSQSGALTVAGLLHLQTDLLQDITLDNVQNDFSSVTIARANNAVIADATDLNIAGAQLNGNLTLTAVDGAIGQTDRIIARGLSANAMGAVNLGITTNQIDSIDGVTGAGVTLANSFRLDVNGAITSTGDNTTDLTSVTGAITINAPIDAGSNGSITLRGNGISQSGTGILTARSLTGFSNGVVDLGLDNKVDELGDFTVLGAMTFRTLQDLSIAGPLAVTGDLDLASGGTLSQTAAGTIAANGLTVEAAGAIDLAEAGNSFVRVLGASGTRVSIADSAGDLSIEGPVTGSTGLVSLTTTGGLSSIADITGTGVTLRGTGLAVTAGTVNARGGLLTLDAGLGNLTLAAGATLRTTGLARLDAGGAAGLAGDVRVGTRIDGAVGGDAMFVGTGNQIGGFGTFSAGGRFDLVNGNPTLAISGAVTSGQAMTLRMTAAEGSLSITSAGSLTVGGGKDLFVEADRMSFGGAVAGTGTLYLRPRTAGRTIGIGDDASGSLRLSTASVANLADGFTVIELGGNDYNGVIELGTASFKDSVIVRAPLAGAAIHVVGQLHVAGDLTLFGPGASTTLDGALITDGGAVTINDRLHVGADAMIDTTGGGSFMNGGNIALNGAVDGTTAYANQLTINAGMNGDLSFAGAVGMDTPLGTVLVPNANSFTADQQFVAAVLDVGVGSGTITAANVNIRDAMIVRGTGGSADIMGTVAGLSNEFAANLVQRPDGPAETYIINGCVMGTLCGVDPNFFVNFELMRSNNVSAPEIRIVTEDTSSTFTIQRVAEMPRSTELVGSRDQEPGSIAPAAGGTSGFGGGFRSPALLPPVDPSSIQYSSVGDWELW